MADAKSRYEIINELTSKREQLVDSKNELEKSIIGNNEMLDQMGRDHIRQVDDLERKQARELEDNKSRAEAHEVNTQKKLKQLTNKESALKEAIEAIKAISRDNN